MLRAVKYGVPVATGSPITVWRTALDQKRPYLDLNDAVRAIKFIIAHDLFDGGIYNVLTLNTTVRSIVDAIRQHVSDLAIQYVDTPIMNQLSYHVSNAKFRRTGFTFDGSLETGIERTIRLIANVRAQPSRV